MIQSYQCLSPVLFLTFNRLDTVKQTLEEILKVNPPRIYLASDGARLDKFTPNGLPEKEIVDEVREYLLAKLDSRPSVKTLFLEANLGCKLAVSQAISWFFSHEEEGIILEDDCLPTTSFFRFCDELLGLYRDEARVFLISGFSGLDLMPDIKARMEADYFFTKYGHIWGWASWANRWAKYEREIEDFEGHFRRLRFCNHRERRYWHKIFSSYNRGEIDTWDYPWTYSAWKRGGLAIQPKNTLIKNIGLNRPDATHTTSPSPFESLPSYEIDFPLQKPGVMQPSRRIERAIFEAVFGGRQNLFYRLANKLSMKLWHKKIFWH